MASISKGRRLLVGGAVGAVGTMAAAKLLIPGGGTPSAAEGPFYPPPPMRRADVDNDLVKIAGQVIEAGGEVIRLEGRVLDRDGAPRPGLRVEIWQCDMNGKYLHDGDRQAMEFDPGFQGFGHDITGEDGSYAFRTIKPVIYPGRTPHIHVKVLDGGREVLTTQFYIADFPTNTRDGLFNRMSEDEARAVSMVFRRGAQGEVATVDMVV